MARTPALTKEIVDAAIEGFEVQKRRIDEQIAQLRAMVLDGAGSASSAGPKKRGRKGRLSPEGRAAIAEAQRRRWAEKKAGTVVPGKAAKTAPKKRKLSAAGRKAISDAAKKRWATKKAAAKA